MKMTKKDIINALKKINGYLFTKREKYLRLCNGDRVSAYEDCIDKIENLINEIEGES